MDFRQSLGRLCLETPQVASSPTTASRSPEASTRTPGSAPHDSRPVVDVTALTSRDDFLLELGQTLGAQAAVRPVESLEDALRGMAGPQPPPVPPIHPPPAPHFPPPPPP